MKKTLLALLLLATGSAKAQITFEHKYPQKVNIFKLSNGDIKYATYVSGTTNQVRVYNQNHSLFRQLSVPLAATVQADVDYLSDKLFNTTPDLEFMVYGYDPTLPQFVSFAQVFSDAGTSLLRVDSTNFVDIYNSAAGTKLVTYQRTAAGDSYYSKVYALGGTRAALKTTDAVGKEAVQPYPNPTGGQVQLPYKVAAGQVGELTVTDATGRTIAHYQVDSTFDHLLFDARGLRSGVYLYWVQVAGQSSVTRRFVVQ